MFKLKLKKYMNMGAQLRMLFLLDLPHPKPYMVTETLRQPYLQTAELQININNNNAIGHVSLAGAISCTRSHVFEKCIISTD